MKKHLTALLGLLLWTNASVAEPVIEIDKIVVTTTRSMESSDVAADEVVTVKSSRPQTKTAADAIKQVVGVHVRRFGGMEDSTAVSIRGSSHNQVKVLLDGIPLETASGEGMGLQQIQLQSLGRIDVYKNFSPGRFGGGAVGGTINLTSQKTQKGFHHQHGLGFGQFKTLAGHTAFSFGGEQNDVLFGFDFRRSSGDFKFLDNNGTPLNTADDRIVTRQNNESLLLHPWLKWQHRFDDDHSIEVVQHYFLSQKGVPGLGSFQSTAAAFAQNEILTGITFKKKHFFWDKLSFRNQIFGRYIKQQFDDPLAEIGLGPTQDNDNQTLVLGNRMQWQWDLLKELQLNTGIELMSEWFLPKDFDGTPTIGSSSKRKQINLYVEPHFELLRQRLFVDLQLQSLNAFYRVNDNDPSRPTAGSFFSKRDENHFAGSVKLNYNLFSKFYLKASAGRALRLPAFIEMFGDQGNTLGNPQLTSEKSWKWDVGFRYVLPKKKGALRRFTFEATYFESYVDDLIQFEVVSGYARAANIGKARVRGVEVSASAKIFKFFEVGVNHTYQRTRDQSVASNRSLVGRPEHDFNFMLDFQHKGFQVGADLNYIDNQFLDALNTQRVDNRVIVNLETSYRFLEHYRVAVEARNVTNSQVVDAVGFPLPGRSFFGRFDVMF